MISAAIDLSGLRNLRSAAIELDRQLQADSLIETNRVAAEIRRGEAPNWDRDTGWSGQNFTAEKYGTAGASLVNPVGYVKYVHSKGIKELSLDRIVRPKCENALPRFVERYSKTIVKNLG